MNILLSPPLRLSPAGERIKPSGQRPGQLVLEHALAPPQAGPFYFLLDSKGPHKACSQGSGGHWAMATHPGLTPDPVSKTIFSLTLQ